MPTWMGWRLLDHKVLLPGFAIAAQIQRRERTVWIVNVYLPPARVTSLLPQLDAAFLAAWPGGLDGADAWMAGDFTVDRFGSCLATRTLLRCAHYLALAKLPVAASARVRSVDRVFRPDPFCNDATSWHAWALPGQGTRHPIRFVARVVSAAHRPPPRLAYRSIPTRAFEPRYTDGSLFLIHT